MDLLAELATKEDLWVALARTIDEELVEQSVEIKWASDEVASIAQDLYLPPYGLLVEAGTCAAFHALTWAGMTYQNPVLFTLTSLDGQPLDKSLRVRVFHGFGDAQLTWRDRMAQVRREAIL